MQPDTRKHLLDILEAARDIRAFVEGLDLVAYCQDSKTRAAVERKLEVMCEACCRLRDKHPGVSEMLPYAHRVIGLRNRIIHGYDSVDDAIIWDVVTTKLDAFAEKVELLMRS